MVLGAATVVAGLAAGVLAAAGRPEAPPPAPPPAGVGLHVSADEPPAKAPVEVAKAPVEVMSEPARSLQGHKERVTSVAYSPDGRWVATAAWDGTARVWDAQTGKEERRLDLTGYVNQIVFSPDNEFVVVAHIILLNAQHIIVLKWRTGEQVHEFPDSKDPKDHCPLLCAALSPDGKHLACGGWGSSTHARADS